MSLDINLQVFSNYEPEQNRIPLKETTNYAGHIYQIYEINTLLFPELPQFEASASQAIPLKKIRGIFLNEPLDEATSRVESALPWNKDKKEATREAIRAGTYDWQKDNGLVANDKDLMLEAIRQNPQNLQYAYPNLKKSGEVALAALSQWSKELDDYKSTLASDAQRLSELLLTAEEGKKRGYQPQEEVEFEIANQRIEVEKKEIIVKQHELKIKTISSHIDPALLGEKEFVLAAIKYHIEILETILPNLETEEFFLEAIKIDVGALEYAPDHLEFEITQAAIEQDLRALSYVSDDLMEDEEFKQFILKIVSQHPEVLHRIDNIAITADKDVVLATIPSGMENFELPISSFSSLWKDREFVLQAVSKNGQFWHKLPHHSKFNEDREILLAAVHHDWTILNAEPKDNGRSPYRPRLDAISFEQPNNWWSDAEFAIVALEQSLEAFKYCTSGLKQDEEFVALLFTKWPALKANRHFLLELGKDNSQALSYADESLQHDLQFAKEAISQNFQAFKYAPSALKKDQNFVKEVIRLSEGTSLEHADIALKQDRVFMVEAVQISGYALGYADPILREDADLIEAALNQIIPHYIKRWEELPDSLKNSPKFMAAAFKKDKNSLKYAMFDVQRGILLPYLHSKDADKWNLIKDHFRSDKSFMLDALSIDPAEAWKNAADDVKKDSQFVLAAASKLCSLAQDPLQKKETAALASAILKEIQAKPLDIPPEHFIIEAAKLAFMDQEVVWQAFIMDPTNLQFADPLLLKDREFMLQCICENFLTFNYIHPDLKQDRAFLKQSIGKNPYVSLFISEEVKTEEPILNAIYQSLSDHLMAFKEDPNKRQLLHQFTAFVIERADRFLLHPEHPLMQEFIQAYTVASGVEDPKNPYYMHARLTQVVQQEALLDDFASVRKRADIKDYAFNDIPEGIIPFSELFTSLEERGIDKKQLEELCQTYYGKEPVVKEANETEEQFVQREIAYREEMEKLEESYLRDVRHNILGQGKLIPALLAQKGKAEDPISLTNMYLHLILKRMQQEDDTRQEGKLSDRENMLLNFASMVKECNTGQADAIEQYFLHAVGESNQANSAAEQIEKTVDSAVQMALLETLGSDALVKELTGEVSVKQMSHQTLYLKNRYYKQLGLRHSPSFDFHSGVIYQALQRQLPHEALPIIKRHFLQRLEAKAKEVLDRSFNAKEGIAFQHWADYFKNNFHMQDSQESYSQFFVTKVEVDEDGDENYTYVGIAPATVTQMLQKLELLLE
jgi:hypothetical protein